MNKTKRSMIDIVVSIENIKRHREKLNKQRIAAYSLIAVLSLMILLLLQKTI